MTSPLMITSSLIRPLTERELLERRELARLRHMAKEAAAVTHTNDHQENPDQEKKEKEDNGKG